MIRALRRLCLTLAGIAAFAAVVALISLATLRTSWFKEWLRGYVVRQTTQRLNGTLSIGGLTGDLFSGITLHDVSIAMNDHTVIAIDTIQTTYSLADIFSRGIVIQNLTAIRPVVTMQRDAGGWELGRLFKPGADDRGSRTRPIEITRLVITDGAVMMVPSGARTVHLESIDAALSLRYEPDLFRFDITRLSLRSVEHDLFIRQAAGLLQLRGDDLLLSRIVVQTPETQLAAEGEVMRYRSAPVFALRVRANPLSLPEVRRLFPEVGPSTLRPAVDVRLNGPLDRLTTDLQMRSSAGDVDAHGISSVGDSVRSFAGRVSGRRLDLAPFLNDAAQKSTIAGDATIDLRMTPPWSLDTLGGSFVANAPRVQTHDYIVERIAAKGRISGRTMTVDARALAFGATTSAVGSMTFRDGPGGATKFDFSGRVSDVDLARLPRSMGAPPAGTRLTGAYHVNATVPAGPGAQVSGDAILDSSTVAGATISAGAAVAFRAGRGDLQYQVDATVSDLDVQRIGEEFRVAPLASDRYRSTLNGTVAATVRGSDFDTMALSASGTLVESSMFSGRFPRVAFDTTIGGGALHVKANGSVNGLDLAVAAGAADEPRLQSSVTGTIETDVTFAHLSQGLAVDSVEGDVTAELGPSRLGRVSLDRASIAGDYHNGVADFQTLDVEGEGVTATGRGTLVFNEADQSGLWIHAETNNLDQVGGLVNRPLTGIGMVDAIISGNRREFVASGSLAGNELKYQQYGALAASSEFSAKVPDLDFARTSVVADSRATFVEIAALHVNQASARTNFADKRVTFDIAGSQPQRTLSAAGSLELLPEAQEVRLERLRVDTQGLTWQMPSGREPVITYRQGAIGVKSFQLANGMQLLSAEGVLGGDSEEHNSLTVTLHDIDMGIVDAWLLRMPQLAGNVNGTAVLTGPLDSPAVNADFRVDRGKFRNVAYESLDGTVKYAAAGADVDLKLQESASQWLTAKGHVPASAFKSAHDGDRFDLHIDSSEVDLGLAQGLTPALSGVKGTVQAKVDLTGTPDDPRAAGAVTVRGGAFTLQPTGVSYTNLEGRIDLLPDRIHIDDLHVLDNQSQQLTASGDLHVAGRQLGDVNLYVSALDFKVLDNRMGHLRLNSDLRLTGTLGKPRLEGELDVSTGSLNLDPILAELGTSAYSTTAADTTGAAGGTETKPAAGWYSAELAVHVVVPNDLVVKANDLKALGSAFGLGLGALNITLGGNLNVAASPGKPITLVGAVNTVRGFYDFQNRRFTILRDGTVRFQGDPINELDPALNIGAERVIQAVTARVNVRGRLRRPDIELTSIPPLEQSDILALIIFNQPLNQLGEGQQVSLAASAGAIAAGAATSQLTQSIASSLGLDQFAINLAPNPGVAAELVVGQQLGPNLYVKVQEGIGDRTQTNVILEYEFTKWLRLQSNYLQGAIPEQQLFQHVQSTGLDLVFTFAFK